MARTTGRYRCADETCREIGFFDYDTKARQREHARELHQRGGWRCTRHTRPDEVLSLDAPTRTRVVILTAERSRRFPDLTELFWREEGRDDVGSGFTSGPGFKAWAKDFPEGTRLVATTTVSLTAPAPVVPTTTPERTEP
jgi:hypothetical protein